jgi:hypothetical protein
MTAGPLVKAMLTTTDSGAVAINFQFNPTSLKFARTVQWADTEVINAAGFPKVAYSRRDAGTLSLSGLMFDTYEYASPTSVLTLIDPIIKSTEVAGSLKRPPVYIFAWGQQEYLKCVVTSIDYELTMFLANGTPVRATVNMSLKEVDKTDL